MASNPSNENRRTDGGGRLRLRERSVRALTPRETTFVAVGVYLLAAIAWLALVQQWIPMPGESMAASASTMGSAGMSMDATMRMADPGVPEAMATSGGPAGWLLYLAMWSVMMIAMMYPSSVPLVNLYYRTLDGISTRAKLARIGAFLGAYTLVWGATGVVPLVANHLVPITRLANSDVLVAGTLFLLGAYQLSPYKNRCLSHCRSPLGFLMHHHRPGVKGAWRTGFHHASFCLGCCWALFVFMVVVGTMNLVWMVAITAVLSLERTVSWGESLARVVGVLALVGGVAVLLGGVGL